MIVSFVGARPNFVKLSVIARSIHGKFDQKIIHTGQHYDFEMNKIFFDQLNLPKPDINLGAGSGRPGWQIGQMLKKGEEALMKLKPHLVLVYGDTNSTLAGALLASKLKIKVGHVEAGLRSFNKSMPEEVNRVLVDHISDILFCPTEISVKNLAREGITRGVHLVGDVMYDAILDSFPQAESYSTILDKLGIKKKGYFLITIHRENNVDNPENLKNIVEAITGLSNLLVFPMHPRTENRLHQFCLYEKLSNQPNILLTKPLAYFDFLILEKYAIKILTDSGGVQKEAYIVATPCVTLREETEWVETVKAGWNILVGTSEDKIIDACENFTPKSERKELFGRNASTKIATILENELKS